MDVNRGDNLGVMLVLQRGQPLTELVAMVVVDETEHRNHTPAPGLQPAPGQPEPGQVAQRLRTTAIPGARNLPVKLGQQSGLHRNPEPDRALTGTRLLSVTHLEIVTPTRPGSRIAFGLTAAAIGRESGLSMVSRMPVLLALFAALSLGYATTWDTILPLTTNPQNQHLGYGWQRSVACDPQGNVHVVWLDQRTSPYQLWYRRFDRTTGLWREESVLTNRSASCSPPGVACDAQGNVHVVWHLEFYPYGIWYKRFDAGTSVWHPDSLLEVATAQQMKYFPSVACRPGSREVHVVWFGDPDTGGNYQVFHREYKPDSGWRRTEQVSAEPLLHDQTSLAVDSAGDICVVWCGNDLGEAYRQVFCRRRVDGNWQSVELVSDMPQRLTQYAPCVAAGSGGVWHFVWHGSASLELCHRIRYRNRSPSGWGDIVVVSDLPNQQQESPGIWCRAGGDCHVVWRGQTASSNLYQLFHACREPDGHWTTPVQLTQRGSGNVSRPAVTADSDTCLHVVWYDNSSGNQDIYYLRGHERRTGQADAAPDRPTVSFRLQPNPVTGPFCRLLCPEGTSFRLSDALGRPLLTGRAEAGLRLDCRNLASGVYFVELKHAGASATAKMVRRAP